jgi:hypothetical protein
MHSIFFFSIPTLLPSTYMTNSLVGGECKELIVYYVLRSHDPRSLDYTLYFTLLSQYIRAYRVSSSVI